MNGDDVREHFKPERKFDDDNALFNRFFSCASVFASNKRFIS